MSNLILFNKPYGVISQFRDKGDKSTLKDFIQESGFYPAGRLDENSEGLLLLTDDGALQARIANPKFKLPKTYWVQVEGTPDKEALSGLSRGVKLKDGKTRPAKVQLLTHVAVPARTPPIRVRKDITDSWISMTISEGKNRQVRRMTAAVGYPTLRLFRVSIGPWNLDGLEPGDSKLVSVNLPH